MPLEKRMIRVFLVQHTGKSAERDPGADFNEAVQRVAWEQKP
jgi:hypothetical protein